MNHTWDKYFDTTSECWTKLQALYTANEHFPKTVVKGRNLHHKFLRSWSKKEGEPKDDDDDNLVSLSEGDHFLAHFYIWKSAKKGYRASAALAIRMMYRKSLKYITAEIAEDIAKVWEHKEYTLTEETKEKISAANKGRKHSEEQRRKISNANKGRTSNRKGKHLSEEQKQKISNALKGKTMSEEAKRKISEVKKVYWANHKGKTMPEEVKKKLSNSLKGRKFSEETKRKMSEARKAYWTKKVLSKMVELNS